MVPGIGNPVGWHHIHTKNSNICLYIFYWVGLGGYLYSASQMAALLVDIALMVSVVDIYSMLGLLIGGHIGAQSECLGSISATTVFASIFALLVGTGTAVVLFLVWLVRTLLLWWCNMNYLSQGMRWDNDRSGWGLVLESRLLRYEMCCLIWRWWSIFLSYYFQHVEVNIEVAHFWFSHCLPFRIFDYDLGGGSPLVIWGSNGVVCCSPSFFPHCGAGSFGQHIFVLLNHHLPKLVPSLALLWGVAVSFIEHLVIHVTCIIQFN